MPRQHPPSVWLVRRWLVRRWLVRRWLVRRWLVPRCLLLAVIVLATCTTCFAHRTGGHIRGAIRNHQPQPTLVPPDEEWPLYYPRRTRAGRDLPAGAPEQLLRHFMNLHTAMRYEEALQIARELVGEAPDRALPHYNLACVLGRLDRTDAALESLQTAIAHGWRNVNHTRVDPDLAPLHGEERFMQLLDRMQTLREQERAPARPLRDEPWEQVVEELGSEIPVILARYHVPGAAVALIEEGACVWTGTFGFADPENEVRVGEETRFRVATPGHLLALVAAAQLDEHDALDLVDVLTRIADAASTPRPPGRWRVSRSHLVSDAFGPVTPSTSIMATRFGASVASFDFLRLSIEVASGKSFVAYCDQHIIEPHALAATSFDGAADASPGHTRLGTPLMPRGEGGEKGPVLTTSARDLGRLLALMMPEKPTVSNAGVLPPDGAARLAAVGALEPCRRDLGLRSDTTPWGTRLQMADLTDGAGCLLRWFPDQRCGIVIVFNSETGAEAAVRIAELGVGGGGL